MEVGYWVMLCFMMIMPYHICFQICLFQKDMRCHTTEQVNDKIGAHVAVLDMAAWINGVYTLSPIYVHEPRRLGQLLFVNLRVGIDCFFVFV